MILNVEYEGGGERHIEPVDFVAVPQVNDTFTFHGSDMDYSYRIVEVIWYGTPKTEKRGWDAAWPTVRLGHCFAREVRPT